jgi:ligand-binding sensor domain-containing protein
MKTIAIFFLLLPIIGAGQAACFTPGTALEGSCRVTAVDSAGVYTWVGTNSGLLRINKKTGRKKIVSLTDIIQPTNYVNDIYCQSEDRVWIATMHGLFLYDGWCFILYSVENSELPENAVLSVEGRDNGVLIFKTLRHGSYIFKRNRFVHQNESLATPDLHAQK